MSIFSTDHGSTKQDPPKSATESLCAKLYILASKPSTPLQAETVEWNLNLCIPSLSPETTDNDTTASIRPTTLRKQSIISLLHQSNLALPNSSAAELPKEAATVSDQQYYFSRLQPSSHSGIKPTNTVLQIFLTSLPSEAVAQASNTTLLDHFVKVLEPIHFTPASALWLTQALYALQVAEVIPPISHGLSVGKFMNFATAYLEHHLQGKSGMDVEEVNYPKILRENEQLERMLNSDTTEHVGPSKM